MVMEHFCRPQTFGWVRVLVYHDDGNGRISRAFLLQVVVKKKKNKNKT